MYINSGIMKCNSELVLVIQIFYSFQKRKEDFFKRYLWTVTKSFTRTPFRTLSYFSPSSADVYWAQWPKLSCANVSPCAGELGKVWNREVLPSGSLRLAVQAFCCRLAPCGPVLFLWYVQYPKGSFTNKPTKNCSYVQLWMSNVL